MARRPQRFDSPRETLPAEPARRQASGRAGHAFGGRPSARKSARDHRPRSFRAVRVACRMGQGLRRSIQLHETQFLMHKTPEGAGSNSPSGAATGGKASRRLLGAGFGLTNRAPPGQKRPSCFLLSSLPDAPPRLSWIESYRQDRERLFWSGWRRDIGNADSCIS